MMARDQWLEALLEAVQHAASREYQESRWFRQDIGVIWPDEVYYELDDLAFDQFFTLHSGEFTPEQRMAWIALRDW